MLVHPLAYFMQDKLSGRDDIVMMTYEEQIELSVMDKFTQHRIYYIFSSPEPKFTR